MEEALKFNAGLRKLTEAAKDLKVATSTLYYKAERKQIPVHYIDGVSFVHRSDYPEIRDKLKKK